MGSWGFRKVLRIGRIARVTIGKKSVGASVGVGPVRVGVNSRGTLRRRITIPRSGLYYEQRDRLGPRSQPKAPGRPGASFFRVGALIAIAIAIGLFLAHVR